MRRRTVALLALLASPCLFMTMISVAPGYDAATGEVWPVLYQCNKEANQVILRPGIEPLLHLSDDDLADTQKTPICLRLSSEIRAQGFGFRMVAHGFGPVVMRNRPWVIRPVDHLDYGYRCFSTDSHKRV